MSRFYASIQGSRGEATRQGTAASGIDGHIRGWDLGIRASVFGGLADTDRFVVTVTGGSNGGRRSVPLAEVSEVSDWPGVPKGDYVRVALGDAFGGGVVYVDRDGTAHSKPHGADAAPCATCERRG